jgi:hypothetical protein
MVGCATEAIARPGAECFDRPLPRKSFGACGTDIFFCINSQHFVLGYFRRVPPGLLFGK